ncbi:aminopeptidase P family protein [uncultured Acetobacteroides sp.]|uniref:aminopeptidase P family protein n=1 Tax=uncultured Acetobacteroides sp. TaxID=1760811 RepID=UPI0029F5A7F1|nr:aminopeptidase P family protein [uncultured Acetobacteroides sp.]
MFPKEVYIERRSRLRSKMRSGIALFVGNFEMPMNYPSNTYRFRQDSNFLYFFGLDNPELVGVMDFDAGVDSIYGNDIDIEDIIWMGPQPTLKEQAAQVGVAATSPLAELQGKISAAIKAGRKIHFLPPYRHQNMMVLSDLLGISYSVLRAYASVELVKAVVSLRSIKDSYEIAEIDFACNVGYQMHVAAMRMCKPGVYEREIAGFIEGVALQGGGGVSFPVILSQHGETLHNHYHGNLLESGRLMITDAGAELASGYASDFTRVTPISGKFTQKQKDIYNIVLAANNNTAMLAKPGVKYQDVHFAAAKTITEGLMALGLMQGNADEAVMNGAHALFLPHGLGHMMGLDVHDMEDLGENFVGYDEETSRIDQFGTAYLRLGRRLEPGFVITNEPGIYFIPALIAKWKSEKINSSFINFSKVEEYLDFGGIRLEDDLLITSTGCRLLGEKRVPITIEEVEEAAKS